MGYAGRCHFSNDYDAMGQKPSPKGLHTINTFFFPRNIFPQKKQKNTKKPKKNKRNKNQKKQTKQKNKKEQSLFLSLDPETSNPPEEVLGGLFGGGLHVGQRAGGALGAAGAGFDRVGGL